MPQIKKKDVPLHIVFPDTNILWDSDKTLVVAPAFDTFWRKNRKKFSLELVIPDVVKGELIFLQTTSAYRATDEINKLMSKVSAISAHGYTHKIKPDELKSRIEARFDRWVSGCKGSIAPVPVMHVEWTRLIKDAIWRVPPFEEDRKDKEIEKGFRDSLILETIVDYCNRHTQADINVAFVCGDRLLCVAANNRLSDNSRFTSYGTLEELESYLSLKRQELTDRFISLILKRASSQFFNKGDDSCLFRQEDVENKIREVCQQYIDDPTTVLGPMASIGLGLGAKWKSTYRLGFWFTDPAFDRIEDKLIFHWKSTVLCVQLYHRTGTALSTTVTFRRILAISVIVDWHARITTNAQFHNAELDEITIGFKDFRPPTVEDIKAFNLPEEVSNQAVNSDAE